MEKGKIERKGTIEREGVIEMDVDEFLRRLADHADNVTTRWDFNLFKIQCSKCGSDDILLLYESEDNTRMGSEYTGLYGSHDVYFCVKCKHCGNAMLLHKDVGVLG